jgi:hypothetical protein
MIIDDSVTLKGNALPETANVASNTTDCIDRVAAGTCLTNKPTFVCYVVKGTKEPTIPEDTVATFTMLTADEANGAYAPVASVYATVDKNVGAIAKLTLPPEGVKRFIKFSVAFNAAISANGGTYEVLTVSGAAYGL